jgi:hypothetical protein
MGTPQTLKLEVYRWEELQRTANWAIHTGTRLPAILCFASGESNGHFGSGFVLPLHGNIRGRSTGVLNA